MSRLFLDMDGTLARFHDEHSYLERMYEEDFFFNLQPFDNMVKAAKLFMEQHPDVPVYIISSCIDSPYCVQDKNKWLDKHLNIPPENRIFPPMGAPKADFIPGGVQEDDYLLDDYNRGLNQFMFDGGSAIKCHNNINQKGLGAHGGSAGNLWVGPMVHVDDRPEMIAAELAQCMGLSFDLQPVKEAYPEVQEVSSDDKINVLDDIRWKAGNHDFQSYKMKTWEGKEFYVPGHRLKSISLNVYKDPDFYKLFQDDVKLGLLSDSVEVAFQQAKRPLVGRIDYLDANGAWEHAQYFRSKFEMDAQLQTDRANKRNVQETWYVQFKPVALSKVKDQNVLTQRLCTEYQLDPQFAGKVASALILPVTERTQKQTELLYSFWHTHEIAEPLQNFLGFSNSAWKVFNQILEEKRTAAAPQKTPSSLTSKINDAQHRTNTASSGKPTSQER